MARLIDGERYEYVGGTSRKFWEWRIYGDEVPRLDASTYFTLKFSWGRIGTTGQSMEERFDSEDYARWKARVKVREKLAKGYSLAGDIARLSPRPRPPAKLYKDDTRPAPRPVARSIPQASTLPAPVILSGVRRVRLRD